MGHNLSRSDTRWRNERSTRNSRHANFNNQPQRRQRARAKKKKTKLVDGGGWSKTNDDLYKRALIEDYNAWLRALPPTDQDFIKEDPKDATLMRKVKNLLCSKSHRKNAVVWPEQHKVEDHQNIVPKIQLSFQQPYQQEPPTSYEKTSWDFYYPTDVVQYGGSCSHSSRESFAEEEIHPGRRSFGVQTSPRGSIRKSRNGSPLLTKSRRNSSGTMTERSDHVISDKKSTRSQETSLSSVPEDDDIVRLKVEPQYHIRRHSAGDYEEHKFSNGDASATSSIARQKKNEGKKKRKKGSWPRTSDYDSGQASFSKQEQQQIDDTNMVYDNFLLYENFSSSGVNQQQHPETSYKDRFWRKDMFASNLQDVPPPAVASQRSLFRETEFQDFPVEIPPPLENSSEIFYENYPTPNAQEISLVPSRRENGEVLYEKKKKKPPRRRSDNTKHMKRNLEADIEKMVASTIDEKLGLAGSSRQSRSRTVDFAPNIASNDNDMQQMIEKQISFILASLLKEGSMMNKR